MPTLKRCVRSLDKWVLALFILLITTIILREVYSMNEQFVNEILNKLRDGELNEYLVKNDQFLEFRSVLVKRDDFKHFQGTALHGGDVKYRYLSVARS